MIKDNNQQIMAKKYKKPHQLINKKIEDIDGVLTCKFGMTDTVYYQTFFKKIRTNLGIKQKDLNNRQIEKYIKILNAELMDWVINNPEGVKLPKMGYFIVSKSKNRFFFDDLDERIEKINSLNISENRKKKIIEKFKYPSEMKKKPRRRVMPFITRLLWFNKRNIPGGRKAENYRFYPGRKHLSRIYNIIKNNEITYQMHNFHEYYAPFYKADQ